MVKELHVFDFDGTLFRSPLPNPKNFSKAEIGAIKSKGGWFHLPPSLCPPAVPHEPEEEWWINHIKERAHEILGRKDCRAVLLTGRGLLFTDRVKEITTGAGLDFHSYHLKPPGNNTLPWKCDLISGLVKDLRVETDSALAELHIYEDRVRHFERFQELAESLKEEGYVTEHVNVVRVDEGDRHLTDEVEQHVLNAMKDMLAEKHSEGHTTDYHAFLLRAGTKKSASRDEKAKEWTAPAGWEDAVHERLDAFSTDRSNTTPITFIYGSAVERGRVHQLAAQYPLLEAHNHKEEGKAIGVEVQKRKGIVYE